MPTRSRLCTCGCSASSAAKRNTTFASSSSFILNFPLGLSYTLVDNRWHGKAIGDSRLQGKKREEPESENSRKDTLRETPRCIPQQLLILLIVMRRTTSNLWKIKVFTSGKASATYYREQRERDGRNKVQWIKLTAPKGPCAHGKISVPACPIRRVPGFAGENLSCDTEENKFETCKSPRIS